ncbi:hypothetical protein PCCS19_43330 [Paenibacillus sp. CCS19]|uniref:DUF4259 domain-containing protein n=1 Tax=Paenibacillus sp. CCS19 TaxID=3158387 RepID=UPI002561818F|nr:DUF4259 domain-containing protein [Paenibacillus cellulosilyticus]GMK41277.1 hypothetical protein PCCS19_43330 [Paenibacillus cellulosilyticus]
MGAWGVKTFENDSALDWISELEDDKDLSIVVYKFSEFNHEYQDSPAETLDSDLSSEVLAAVEIVAVLRGAPGGDIPPAIERWLKKKSYDRNLVSVFNEMMKSDAVDDETKLQWKAFSKEEKWKYIVSALADDAVKLIEIILSQSELKDLWEESDKYEDWLSEVNYLKSRCGG